MKIEDFKQKLENDLIVYELKVLEAEMNIKKHIIEVY